MKSRLVWEELVHPESKNHQLGYKAGPFLIEVQTRSRMKGRARKVFELYITSGPYSYMPICARPTLASAKAWASKVVSEIRKSLV